MTLRYILYGVIVLMYTSNFLALCPKALVRLEPQHKVCTVQKQRTTFKKIGFVIKYDDPEAELLARTLAQLALSLNRTVLFEKESTAVAEQLKKSFKKQKNRKNHRICVVSKQKLAAASDLIVTIGGDGTILSIARLMHSKHSPPLLGIYKGTLGFLTEFSPEEAPQVLTALLNNSSFSSSSRSLLEATIIRDNKVIFTGQAANDAVIKIITPRVLELEVLPDSKPGYKIYGDGVILSTPTGSTGYSLSAGGPIVYPETSALLITPLNAMGLSLRTVIMPDTTPVTIRLIKRPGTVQLSLDSQETQDLLEKDTILIKQARNTNFRLITKPNQNYFSILKDKLTFGKAF